MGSGTGFPVCVACFPEHDCPTSLLDGTPAEAEGKFLLSSADNSPTLQSSADRTLCHWPSSVQSPQVPLPTPLQCATSPGQPGGPSSGCLEGPWAPRAGRAEAGNHDIGEQHNRNQPSAAEIHSSPSHCPLTLPEAAHDPFAPPEANTPHLWKLTPRRLLLHPPARAIPRLRVSCLGELWDMGCERRQSLAL